MSGHVPQILGGLGKETIFRELYENSPDLYRTVNLEGRIILCNKSYAKKLGYSISEILCHDIFDHVAKKSHELLQDTFKKWKENGNVSNIELWLKKKDGSDFPVLLSVNNLYDASEKIIGSNTVIRDISELYFAKNEIDLLKTEKFAVIGQLSSRIAHDIRNPLAIINNAVQILSLQNNPKSKKHSLYFKKIENAVMRISHQVDDVLDYVKPKPIHVESYSLLDIICSVVDQFTMYEDILINIPKNDVQIQCDEEQLGIVFANLILNAIQSMNDKGKITMRIKEQTSRIVIEVEDTGNGIPDEQKTKIFEPLFTTKQKGTGLGLASCQAIIYKHNGIISVTSTLGTGTTFTIDLPKNLLAELTVEST